MSRTRTRRLTASARAAALGGLVVLVLLTAPASALALGSFSGIRKCVATGVDGTHKVEGLEPGN